MDREKFSLRYVRLRDKAISCTLYPLIHASIRRGIKVNKVVYGKPEDKLTAAELYADKSAKKPVMIYAHGGGWVQGSHHIRNPYCSRIAEEGFYVLNINYELAPDAKHPVQIRNMFRAIEYIYEKKDEYNLDTDCIFLGGDSAGAHIAASAAGVTVNPRLYDTFSIDFPHKDDFSVKGLVLISGVFEFFSCKDVDFSYMRLYLTSYIGHDLWSVDDLEEFLRRRDIMDMCPAHLVNSDFPPCFVITGEKDRLRPASDTFYRVLAENDVDACYFLGTGALAMHGFPLFINSANGKKAMRGVVSFLREKLDAVKAPKLDAGAAEDFENGEEGVVDISLHAGEAQAPGVADIAADIDRA